VFDPAKYEIPIKDPCSAGLNLPAQSVYVQRPWRVRRSGWHGQKKFTNIFPQSGIVERGGHPMKIRNLFLSGALLAGLAVSGVTIAQHVDPLRHPNLAAADGFINQAIGALDVAQHANEYDMGGHAAHAKELLRQAKEEIKMAAREANHNHH